MNRIFNLNKLISTNIICKLPNLKFSNSLIRKTQETLANNLKAKPKTPSLYLNEYECIFQFGYIKQLRLFSRIKIYQTGLSILFGIASVGLYEMEYFNNFDRILAVNGSMIFALIMLLIISRQTVKIVGRLYVNKEQNKVLISHLNFMGKRRDFIVNKDEILPLSSIEELKDTFLQLKIKNMDGSMLMILPYSKVINKNAFLSVLKVK